MSNGGIFNHYKANYSPETQKLLQVLMKEARLSLVQRKDFNARIMCDAPLPPRVRSAPPKVNSNLFGIKKNYFFSKRSQDQIMSAGYYEPEPYHSTCPIVNREKEKEELAHIMTFGTRRQMLEKTKKVPEPPQRGLTREQRLEELRLEIEDRIQFLKDMRALGQAARYEVAMKQEIAAKQRDFKKVESMTDEDFKRLDLNRP